MGKISKNIDGLVPCPTKYCDGFITSWIAGMADEHARELNRRFPNDDNREYQRSVDDLLKEIHETTRDNPHRNRRR